MMSRSYLSLAILMNHLIDSPLNIIIHYKNLDTRKNPNSETDIIP